MTFIWPWMLLSLLFVPVMVAIYFLLRRRSRRDSADLGPLAMPRDRAGRSANLRRGVTYLFFLLGLSLLLFGLARPEMVVSLPRVEGTVILAFDVSNSMTAEDLEPNRLEAAKSAARAFVQNQPSTIAIGVVAFSNGGLLVQAPTHDQAAVMDALGRLSAEAGTSLGEGIFTSLNAIAGKSITSNAEEGEDGSALLRIDDYSSAVIMILSDGENTRDPDPLELAQIAADAGVRIYPVGVGSPQGSTIEVDGFNIVTYLNEALLQEIASVTNGSYFYADSETSLQEIYEDVDLQLTIQGEKAEATSLLAGAGLAILLVGGMLSLIWFGRLP